MRASLLRHKNHRGRSRRVVIRASQGSSLHGRRSRSYRRASSLRTTNPLLRPSSFARRHPRLAHRKPRRGLRSPRHRHRAHSARRSMSAQGRDPFDSGKQRAGFILIDNNLGRKAAPPGGCRGPRDLSFRTRHEVTLGRWRGVTSSPARNGPTRALGTVRGIRGTGERSRGTQARDGRGGVARAENVVPSSRARRAEGRPSAEQRRAAPPREHGWGRVAQARVGGEDKPQNRHGWRRARGC